MHVKESCHCLFLQIVDLYLIRYGDTAMQSKVHVSRSNRAFLSPTRENGSGSRIVSYPDPDSRSCGWITSPQLRESGSGYETSSRTEKGDSSGKRGLTLHCCISITDKVKINDLRKSIVTGLLYVHIDFEVIWTFLQRATSPKYSFVERSGVARSVRNRKLIA